MAEFRVNGSFISSGLLGISIATVVRGDSPWMSRWLVGGGMASLAIF